MKSMDISSTVKDTKTALFMIFFKTCEKLTRFGVHRSALRPVVFELLVWPYQGQTVVLP